MCENAIMTSPNSISIAQLAIGTMNDDCNLFANNEAASNKVRRAIFTARIMLIAVATLVA